ncbi:ComF family protein [Colwellia sp. D2M02]|nr:ComF family protein [Colwellia sp. D2M02]
MTSRVFLSYLAKLKQQLFSLSSCDLCGLDIITENDTENDGINSKQQYLICQYCQNDLPYFKQELIHGDLLMWPAVNHALPKIKFDRLFALAPYLPPFTQWLAQLKYHGRFELGQLFAVLLAQQWQHYATEIAPEVVLSVPLHLSKWQLRGYNQAHLIAKPFAQALQLKYLPNAVSRIKKDESQMGKTGQARRKNLKNSFKLTNDFSDVKHVILIDDVVTTGTTASEISRLLKAVGVETVTVVAVCLTLPKV